MSKRLPRYSIRKLTIGAASVLIGVAFASAANSETVKAADAEPAAPKVEEKSQPAVSADQSKANEAKTETVTAVAQKTESKPDKQTSASVNNPEQIGHEQATQSKPEDAKKAPIQKDSTEAPVKAAIQIQLKPIQLQRLIIHQKLLIRQNLMIPKRLKLIRLTKQSSRN